MKKLSEMNDEEKEWLKISLIAFRTFVIGFILGATPSMPDNEYMVYAVAFILFLASIDFLRHGIGFESIDRS